MLIAMMCMSSCLSAVIQLRSLQLSVQVVVL